MESSKTEVVFTDAQQMAKEYSSTFFVPSQSELNAIKVGDGVKVAAAHERFWVNITSVDGDSIIGIVDNDLVREDKHGLSLGSVVQFEKRHVYTIISR